LASAAEAAVIDKNARINVANTVFIVLLLSGPHVPRVQRKNEKNPTARSPAACWL
jgi:hypothetical protein